MAHHHTTVFKTVRQPNAAALSKLAERVRFELTVPDRVTPR
jgi:hypothetical protein